MKTRQTSIVLVIITSALFALGGCAASNANADADGRATTQSPVVREMNRADAIASARQDALRNYGAGWASHADARYQGGFWVVELQATSGYRLRYAISAHDGTIRERSMVQ
jgi:hypothetical protein